MKFLCRFLFLLAPIPLLSVVGGCASAPPENAFADGAALAGFPGQIRFVGEAMPLDVPSDGASTLALSDAVRATLDNDPGVQMALARVRVALAESRQARLLPNPVIDIAFRFPDGGGKPIIDAGLTADLVSLLVKPRQISAADHRLRAAASDAIMIVLDTLVDLQERYTAVQTLDAQVGTLEARKKLIQQLLDLAQARMQAGEAGRLDIITLQSERAALDVEITQMALDRREKRLALTRLIGEPSGAANWELTAWSPPQRMPVVPEAEWIEAALRSRPEIQARRWELAALGDELAVANLGMFEGGEVGAASERDGTWSVGPAITIPIPFFDWGQARRAKVAAERVEARQRLTQTQRQVVEEVRRAIEILRASEAVLEKVRTELIPLAEQRRSQAEASYKNGFVDITAVLLAEQDAQAARAKLIELQQKVSLAGYRLQRAAGGPGVFPATQATTQASTGATTQATTQTSTEQP